MLQDCGCGASAFNVYASAFAGIKLYCLVTEACVCEQFARGRYLTLQWPGVESATSKSHIQRLNHYTTRVHEKDGWPKSESDRYVCVLHSGGWRQENGVAVQPELDATWRRTVDLRRSLSAWRLTFCYVVSDSFVVYICCVVASASVLSPSATPLLTSLRRQLWVKRCHVTIGGMIDDPRNNSADFLCHDLTSTCRLGFSVSFFGNLFRNESLKTAITNQSVPTVSVNGGFVVQNYTGIGHAHKRHLDIIGTVVL